jgi:LuxR family transcriptional regulator, maltose regulon positive regulatory protein
MSIEFVANRAIGERWEQPDTGALQQARAYLNEGEVNRAEKLLTPHKLSQQDAFSPQFQFALASMLGESYLQQGRLHLAAATYHPLLDMVALPPREPAEFSLLYGLCDLYYEWGRFDHVQQYLNECLLGIAEQRLPRSWALEGYLRQAWSLWAVGRDEAAAAAIRNAASIARQTKEPGCVELVKAHQAKFRLRHNDLKGAMRQLMAGRPAPDDSIPYGSQFAHVTLVRLLIAQGDALTALRMLDRHILTATEAGRNRNVIEFLVLQALAYRTQGDLPNATAALAEALCRAEREEYIQTFLDEGPPLADLLHCSAAQGITLVYVRRLLTAFADSPLYAMRAYGSDHAMQDHFTSIEKLSGREIEVLRLMADGCPNYDIAIRLSIAASTVKKHVANILAKLGARNRTQAAASAHKHQLI